MWWEKHCWNVLAPEFIPANNECSPAPPPAEPAGVRLAESMSRKKRWRFSKAKQKSVAVALAEDVKEEDCDVDRGRSVADVLKFLETRLDQRCAKLETSVRLNLDDLMTVARNAASISAVDDVNPRVIGASDADAEADEEDYLNPLHLEAIEEEERQIALGTWTPIAAKCPAGHTMPEFETDVVFVCDACAVDIAKGVQVHDCASCDYTLCMKCYVSAHLEASEDFLIFTEGSTGFPKA